VTVCFYLTGDLDFPVANITEAVDLPVSQPGEKDNTSPARFPAIPWSPRPY